MLSLYGTLGPIYSKEKGREGLEGWMGGKERGQCEEEDAKMIDRKVRRERRKQKEPSNFLLSTHSVPQMNSIWPIQLAAGTTEAEAPRPQLLRLMAASGTPPSLHRFSHLMLKEALVLRASSPVTLSRATHWKAPES